MDRKDRIVGCILGGAVGDAMGAPVEFASLSSIRDQFGPDGIAGLSPAFGRIGSITDDTQMTLFTAEGLLRAEAELHRQGKSDVIGSVHQAYLRWLLTQRESSDHKLFPLATARENLGWLYRLSAIRVRRAPGSTCILGLRSDQMGTMERPVNSSKGCGGLMRVAPAGLFCEDPRAAFDLGCKIAALTHGHPTGYLAAGVMAAVVNLLADGTDLPKAIDQSVSLLKERPYHDEVLQALEKTLAATIKGEASAEVVEELGAGWIAEEALAISLYCALVGDGEFRKGVLLAVNHSGDSDSTGAVTGSLLGTLLGKEQIPPDWLVALELRSEIEQMGMDLACRYEDCEAWHFRYPV
jgi:ADP-ribosyl-[dinitrogen reductase] hydrolase